MSPDYSKEVMHILRAVGPYPEKGIIGMKGKQTYAQNNGNKQKDYSADLLSDSSVTGFFDIRLFCFLFQFHSTPEL